MAERTTSSTIGNLVLAVGLVVTGASFSGCGSNPGEIKSAGSEFRKTAQQTAQQTNIVRLRTVSDSDIRMEVIRDPFSATCEKLQRTITFDMKETNNTSHTASEITAAEGEATNLLKIFDNKGCKADQGLD